MKHMHKLLGDGHHGPLCDFLREKAGKLGDNLVTIGWDNDTASRNWIDFFREDLGFKRVMIIEAHEQNALVAARLYNKDPHMTVIVASIQKAVQHDDLWTKPFNTCIWSHGPEHVSPKELKKLLPRLYTKLDTAFIAWTPWGNYYGEDAKNPNQYQRHKIIVPTPDVFEEIDPDLTISTCDIENGPNGLVWMYKWLKENTK